MKNENIFTKTKNIFLEDQKTFRKVKVLAEKAMSLEEEFSKLTDEEIKENTNKYKEEYKKAKNENEKNAMYIKALANFRETLFRVEGYRPYLVQCIGALIIMFGEVAEMKTGEGKTYTAALAGYLAVCRNRKVHIVTVNDYLVQRDQEEMEPIHNFLGLQTSFNIQDLSPQQKREAYQADIMYSVNAELGFDYMKDNLVSSPSEKLQGELDFCIIDEVDSILIDEAKTPLIISAPGENKPTPFVTAAKAIKTLTQDEIKIDYEEKQVSLNNKGISKIENFFGWDNMFDGHNRFWVQKIYQALQAEYLFKINKDYIIKDKKTIELVDASTGRVMEGRKLSDGLHQALEAKESVEITDISQTQAQITYQNYFKLYKNLAGMTGTAKTSEEEFNEVYDLQVVKVPTNRGIQRIDDDDVLFATEEAKYDNVIARVEEIHSTGQPILIGSVSIENSERISKKLKEKGLKHEVLNAEKHEEEASIVKKAGQKGAITVATNMAGRGTDIKLSDEVKKELGGLAVIATEKHESKRIDDQLRGRAGRQGDVGYSVFFVSLEDELMKRSMDEKHINLITKLSDIDTAIESKALKKSVLFAQDKMEAQNFESRKNLQKYDDVLNSQRKIVYQKRNDILEGDLDLIDNMMLDMIPLGVEVYLNHYIWTKYQSKIEELLKHREVSVSLFKNTKMDEIEKFVDEKNSMIAENDTRYSSLLKLLKVRKSVYFEIEQFSVEELNEMRKHLMIEIHIKQRKKLDYLVSKNEDLIKKLKTKSSKPLKEEFYKNVRVDLRLTEEENEKIQKIKSFSKLKKNLESILLNKYNEKKNEEFLVGCKHIIFNQIDKLWEKHLNDLAALQEVVKTTSYIQQDPLTEYQQKSYDMFKNNFLNELYRTAIMVAAQK